MRMAIVLALLAGCSLQKGMSLSGGAQGAGPSGATSSTAEDPDAERARMEQFHAERGQSSLDEGAFLRHEFEALAGLAVADAKAKAKSFGHTGDVRVRESDDFVAGCAPGIVCSATDERGGQSGMGDSDSLLLWTNKTLAIQGPPD